MSDASPSVLPFRDRTTIHLIPAAIWLLSAAAAVAAPPDPRPATDARASTISLADLDLATPDGVRLARKRITAVAQRLCWQMGDANRASNRATVSACVRDAVAESMKSVSAPKMVAANEHH
jgi:UrcA family protein